MSLENKSQELISGFLSGSLRDGIVISGIRYRLCRGLEEIDLIRESESHWGVKHALPEDDLIRDANEIQILALDESGKAIGRCSSVRMCSEAHVDHVPDWESFYRAETQKRLDLLEIDSPPLHRLSRHEGTGIIVDPERRGENIGFYSMVFMVRAIAEKALSGAPFESFTWSIHNPGYQAWLGDKMDSALNHQAYIQLVLSGSQNDPILTPYLKAMSKLGPLEEAEGIVAQTPGGLIKILNHEGGCAGYAESCERGVRVDGTQLVQAFMRALGERI